MKVVAPLILAVVLVGTGIFFVTQDLGDADQYASVAGFLLALAVAGFTLIAYLRRQDDTRRPEAPPTAEQPFSGASPSASGNTYIYKPGAVITGAAKKVKLFFFNFFFRGGGGGG